MRIVSTKFPHVSARSADVSAVITPSRFPLALTAQELAKATLQVCKWRVTLSGYWSVSLKMSDVVGGVAGPIADVFEDGEIELEVELDNRSAIEESVVLANQEFLTTGSTTTGVVLTSSDGLMTLNAVYGAGAVLSMLQPFTPSEYAVSHSCRWLRDGEDYIPSLVFEITPQYASGNVPYWGGTPTIKSNFQSGDDLQDVGFLGENIPCGVSWPAMTGEPPSFDPADGKYVWNLSASHALTCSIEPVQWREYDPDDGDGPIYDQDTGAILRSLY